MNERELTDAKKLNQAMAIHPGVMLHLDSRGALIAMSQIQLALRHPGNNSRSSAIARGIVESLILLLARGDKEIEALLRRGDDRQFDTPVSAAQLMGPRSN